MGQNMTQARKGRFAGKYAVLRCRKTGLWRGGKGYSRIFRGIRRSIRRMEWQKTAPRAGLLIQTQGFMYDLQFKKQGD